MFPICTARQCRTRWRSAGAVLAAALVAAAWCTPVDAQPGPGAPQRPRPGQQEVRPLDPLTPAERESAIRLVQADDRVRRVTQGREFAVAYTELLVAKIERGQRPDTPERPAIGGRMAEVLISVFSDGFTGVRAVVDLERGTVTEVGTHAPAAAGARPSGDGPAFRVPFSPEERRLGREVALRSREVRALLGARADEWEADGLPIVRPIPELCPSGRCMLMVFNRGDTYLTSTVIVDVTTRTARVVRGTP